MRLAVSVPVLSEQIVVAEPIVSHASRCLTRFMSFIIWLDEIRRDCEGEDATVREGERR